MSFMEWLFEKTPDETDDAPAPAAVVVPPLSIASDDPDEVTPAEHDTILEEVFTIIDYRDAEGNETRRRITMKKLSRGSHAPLLRAICHERHARRSFRCDRIICFIEPNGEVIETKRFFREILGINLAAYDPTRERARTLRSFIAADLSLLVAIARSDNEFHRLEVGAIVDYALKESARQVAERKLEIRVTDPLKVSLAKSIKKMRPTRAVVEDAMIAINDYDASRKARLADAIEKVIEADGQMLSAEINFVNSLPGLVANILRKR